MARHMTFHIGEFAQLTGVNKRTLHYYDAEGIFSPDSVESNGYRSYSSRQFYPFYMIRMFRDMGLDLAEIKEYMQGRTPEKLAHLLLEQEAWLKQEIKKLRRMEQIVAKQRQILTKAPKVCLNVVEEKELPEQWLVVSRNLRQFHIDEAWDQVEAEFAAYMREVLAGEILTGYTFGALVARQDFMVSGCEQVVSYFCVPTDKNWRKLPARHRLLRPAGRYVVTYFAGDYMNTTAAYERIRAYMAQHGQAPGEYAYEESLIEDMSTANPQEYITRVALPIAAVDEHCQ